MTFQSSAVLLTAPVFRGAIAAALIFLASNLRATPPTPPARLALPENFQAAEVQLSKLALPVRVVVQKGQKITDLSIKVTSRRLTPGKAEFEQMKSEVIFEKQSKGSEEFERGLEVPLKAEGPGEVVLDIRLNGHTAPASGFSDRIVRYLVIDTDKRIRMLTPEERQRRRAAERHSRFDKEREKNPESHPMRLVFSDTAKAPTGIQVKPDSVPRDKQLGVRPAALTEFLRKHSVDHEAKSWQPQDSITVKGRVVFQDIDGIWKPLVNASVDLWDSDFLSDEHLGAVATDWDGRWSFNVNNDDGWFQDGRDIYYSFRLDNTRWSVSDCSSDPYQWTSAVHDDLSDGTVLDFGDETAGDNVEALQVWSTINLAWNHAVTVGGWDPGKVDACFPASGTLYNGKLNVAGSDNDGPDSITHEYGHAVMAHAYPDGNPSPGGGHGFGDCAQNQSLAWSEGWATGFMLSLRSDGEYNWHEGQPGQPIENFSSSCGTIIGEQNEGWVAASLLDMLDSSDDDNGGDATRGRSRYSDHNVRNEIALATMLRDTMVGSGHNDVLQFWYSLSGELNSTQPPLGQEIMYYNYMSVFPPDSCVASKVLAKQVKDPEEFLTGLRRFRDLTLKNWAGGREWINAYYYNSPEVALLLLRKPELVPDSLKVAMHFAEIGRTVANHEKYLALMESNPPALPEDVQQSILKVAEGLEPNASAELKAALAKVRKEVKGLRGVKIQELVKRIEKRKEETAGKPLPAIRQHSFTPASKEALESKQLRALREEGMPPAPR